MPSLSAASYPVLLEFACTGKRNQGYEVEELDHFVELEFEKIFFLNSSLNSHKTSGVTGGEGREGAAAPWSKPGGSPMATFQFFFFFKWMDHIEARRGDHGAMASPVAMAL